MFWYAGNDKELSKFRLSSYSPNNSIHSSTDIRAYQCLHMCTYSHRSTHLLKYVFAVCRASYNIQSHFSLSGIQHNIIFLLQLSITTHSTSTFIMLFNTHEELLGTDYFLASLYF